MTPIEALLISIELLREAHNRLHEVGEATLATELAGTYANAIGRLIELRKDNAR